MRPTDIHAMVERERFPMPVCRRRIFERWRMFLFGLAIGLSLGTELTWLVIAKIIHL